MTNDLKAPFLYCTAIVQSTKKIGYNALIEKLSALQEVTSIEAGCILFKIVPLDRYEERFALWEIWENKEAFYAHHQKDYTKAFFSEQLDTIELFESSEKVSL